MTEEYEIEEVTFKDGKHTFTIKRTKDGGYIVTEIDGKKITSFSKEEILKIQKETKVFKDRPLKKIDKEMLKLVFPTSKSYIR